MTDHRVDALLSRLDNLNVAGAIWVVLPIVAIGDLFCTFDHYAPWSLAAWAAALGLILLSISLHGIWRLGLALLPGTAMGAVLIGAVVFLTVPYWRPPLFLGLGTYLLPTTLGLFLWVRLLEIRRPTPVA